MFGRPLLPLLCRSNCSVDGKNGRGAAWIVLTVFISFFLRSLSIRQTVRVFFYHHELAKTADRGFLVVVVLTIYAQAYVCSVCSLTHCLGWYSHIWARSIWDSPLDAVNPQRIVCTVHTQPDPSVLPTGCHIVRTQQCIVIIRAPYPQAYQPTDCSVLSASQSRAF